MGRSAETANDIPLLIDFRRLRQGVDEFARIMLHRKTIDRKLHSRFDLFLYALGAVIRAPELSLINLNAKLIGC